MADAEVPAEQSAVSPQALEKNEFLGRDNQVYKVVDVSTHHGPFRKAVPCMPVAIAVILCIFNVCCPGLGTFFSAFTVLCNCATEHKTKCTAFLYNLLGAVIQIVTALIIVGWIWSIMWGVIFVNLSIRRWLRIEERDHTTSLLDLRI